MGSEIPVWVGGMQKWVTGVTKRTSCEDIVKAVLTFTDRTREAKVERDLRRYTLVERWRKVERPLDSKSRILKVWKTWGDEQCNVRFLLKKASSSSSQKDFRTSRKQRRQHVSRSGGRSHRAPDEASDGSSSSSTTAEDLKRLISLQEMTLSSQNKQLRLKDDEIELFETRMHLTRMRDIGENYVQDTYLSEVTDSDSSSSSADLSAEQETSSEASELYQRVQELCQRIRDEEGHIRDLSCRIRKSVSLRDKNARCEREEEESTRVEIQRLMSVNERQRVTIDQNDKTLTDCDQIGEEKASYIQQLETDFVDAETESLRLQEELDILQQEFLESEMLTCELSEGGFDSNSDTGISSMHSGEESGYVLDTLV